MHKLYFNVLMTIAVLFGGGTGWAIYTYRPYLESVPTCGVSVQVLTKVSNNKNTLDYGADLNLDISRNRMMVRGTYYHGGLAYNINRIINFSESLHYPHSQVTVASVQKEIGDTSTELNNVGLKLVKGDQFDLLYKRTYGGRYFVYLDSFKLGECQVAFH